jgi:hypothetical protein
MVEKEHDMLVEFADEAGKLIMGRTEIDHRPAPGQIFTLNDEDYEVTSHQPRTWQKEVPMGAGPRLMWVTRFTVKPYLMGRGPAVADAIARDAQEVAAG